MLTKLAKELEEAIKENRNLEWKDGFNSLVSPLVDVMLDFPEKPSNFNLKVIRPKLYEKVILVSGGADSSIMWELNKKIDSKLAIYVNLGHQYVAKELEALEKFGINYLKLDYPLSFGPMWNHIIPTRNFLLIALAEEYVKHEGEIWLGAVQGESSPDKGDKSDLFFRMVEELIWRTKHKKVTIKTLKGKTKNDWLKWYLETVGDDKILHTITCFEGGEQACGRCQACLRKWISLKYCNISEEFIDNYFKVNPYYGAKEAVEKYKTNMARALELNDFGHYSKDRCEQDLKVILDFEEKVAEKC
jgi:7-cyano-7-deazaguanine synthase in queuosine biosynthesis